MDSIKNYFEKEKEREREKNKQTMRLKANDTRSSFSLFIFIFIFFHGFWFVHNPSRLPCVLRFSLTAHPPSQR